MIKKITKTVVVCDGCGEEIEERKNWLELKYKCSCKVDFHFHDSTCLNMYFNGKVEKKILLRSGVFVRLVEPNRWKEFLPTSELSNKFLLTEIRESPTEGSRLYKLEHMGKHFIWARKEEIFVQEGDNK
jgi:hypothetical protein